MMTMSKFFRVLRVVMLSLPISLFGAVSAAMADGKDRTYEKQGHVHEVNYGTRSITIDALDYKLSSIVPVHTTHSGLGSLASLRADDEIRYTVIEKNGQKRVTEIWLLPKGTVIGS